LRTYLVAFVLSLVAGLISTRLIRDLALKFGLFDKGGGRKVHTRPIPRLGGVAVALSATIPLAGLALWRNDISRELLADQPLLLGGIGGGLIMLAVGLFDDLKGARAWFKLGGQIAAASVVYAAGIRIEAISIPFSDPLHLGLLSAPATVFWMVLVMNAVNLIDGLDGLAGGVVVLAGGTLFVMSVIEDNVLAALLLSVVVGATLGFLAYNVNPATIFLGDTGSLFLGFVLALVSVHSSQKSYALFSIVAAMLALGLPIFDLGMAVVRRYLSGQPIFRADQHHVHHLLLRKGFTQSQSVIVLFAGAIVLEGLALTFIYADDRISAVAIAALVPLVFVVVKALGYGDLIKKARKVKVMASVEAQAELRAREVTRLRGEMEGAADLDEVWDLVVEAAKALGFEQVELELVPCNPVLREEICGTRTWARSAVGEGTNDVRLQGLITRDLRLHFGPQELGRLHVLCLAENEVMRSMDAALGQVLADGISHALVALKEREHASALRPEREIRSGPPSA
jgi:UDP-GlcNAc:undecaprenyl-phosphate/decaprenyl-phosphate GlcNAc-1-phosphate transferase